MKRLSLTVGLLVSGISGASAFAAEPSTSVPGGASAATTTSSTGDGWIDTPPVTDDDKRPPVPAPKPKTPAPGNGATQSQFVAPQPAPAAGPASAAATSSTAAANVDGQWVYTEQYGWVWMPYDRAYTYVAPEGHPYMYMYYPAVGWCWLYSPWVFGWGTMPYWGVYGPARFAWYARPWFRRPIGWNVYYHGGYQHGGYRHGGYWNGAYGHGGYTHGWHGGGGHRIPAFGGGRGHR
jgi:hypothetical protein